MRVFLVTALLGLATVRGQIGASNCSDIEGWGNADLATSLRPVFDYDASGFLTTDTITVAWDQPMAPKFIFQNATVFSADADTTETVSAAVQSPNDVEVPTPVPGELHSRNCYERRTLQVQWRHVVTGSNTDLKQNDTHLIYTAVLSVWNFEDLNSLRGIDRDRYVESQFPFQIVFPRTVAAAFNPTIFDNANVLAAIVLQETTVDLTSVNSVLGTFDAAVRVRLITSVQYPFRLDSGAFPGQNLKGSRFEFTSSPAGVTDAMITSFSLEAGTDDCPDPTAAGSPNAGDVNPDPSLIPACLQFWTLRFDPGTKDEPCTDPNDPFACNVCEIDGQYKLTFVPECQPGFLASGENCPNTLDDQGSPSNVEVSIVLDSEDFCPKVVEEIELTATLSVYKNAGRNIGESTNFVLGQTMYFKAVVGPTPATIARSIVKLIRVDWSDGSPGFNYYANPTPFGAAPANPFVTDAAAARVIDSDDERATGLANDGVFQAVCGGGASCDHHTVHFEWKLNEEVFAGIAADSSRDIDITVTIEIEFEGVPRTLLLDAELNARRDQTATLQNLGVAALPSPETTQKAGDDGETSAVAGAPLAALAGLGSLLAVAAMRE